MSVKYWETIGERLMKAGWSWGYVRFVQNGRYIDCVDAHRGDGKRYVIWSDDKLSAYLELEKVLKGR